jgi:hypothetical protein
MVDLNYISQEKTKTYEGLSRDVDRAPRIQQGMRLEKEEL